MNQLLPIRIPAARLRRAALALALALGAQAPALAAGDLLAVDPDGQPVAGVQLQLVVTQVGVFGDAAAPATVTTGENGRVSPRIEGLPPLDVQVLRGQGWAVDFLHAPRRVDESQAPDLLGAKPRVMTLEGTTTVVLRRTGVLALEIDGARDSDTFHVTLVDDRPEPFSHRNKRWTGTFKGARGELEFPAGRGSLFICQEGYLGSPTVAGSPDGRVAPLLVAIQSGERSDLRVRLIGGPTTTIQAPFSQIPFETLEALAPDGVTTVGSFPFKSSPLRLESRIPVALGTGVDQDLAPGQRYPKHFVRAAGVPLLRPKPEVPLGAPERETEPPPMDLTFTVDLGGKLRLPEVEGGWVLLANNAAGMRSGMSHAGPSGRFVETPDLGVIELPGRPDTRVARRGQALPPLPPEPSWTSHVVLEDSNGERLAHGELLISLYDGTLARGIADAKGRLEIRGVRGEGAVAAPIDSVGVRCTLTAALEKHAPGKLVAPERSGRLVGRWRTKTDAPKVGQIIAVMPASIDEAGERARFMTRAFSVAITDSKGQFALEGLPEGRYELIAGRGEPVEIEIGGDGDPLELSLDQDGEALTLSESDR